MTVAACHRLTEDDRRRWTKRLHQRPKLAETVIEPRGAGLRDVAIGRCCEVLGDTAMEYSSPR